MMRKRTVEKRENYGVAQECTAYACGMCDRVYTDKAEATECCRCLDCGTKFPHDFSGQRCGHCAYGSQLREARADVQRSEERLTSAKKRLAQLLRDKRPRKGAAVS